ncbi:MAG: CYTH domain-containing protein [Candidatus Paceibacterota bacterium]
MHEIETKILEVNVLEIKEKLKELNAKEIQNARLVVDWYGPKGLTHDGDDPWYLRIRTYSSPLRHEVTWKAKSKLIGASREHKEINFSVSDSQQMENLLEELNLEKYAHQEKKRISWKLENVQFDLDTYPKMPAYLEIEAQSEKDINEMIKKLNLEKNKTWNDGERTLIKGKYKLDWFNMRF